MRTMRKTVPVGDIEIACTIVGEGTPLLVLHGAIGLGSTYMRALDPWGDQLQLIHYDQRGSGNTPIGDVQRVSFAGGVEDLEGLRHNLGLGRAYLAVCRRSERTKPHQLQSRLQFDGESAGNKNIAPDVSVSFFAPQYVGDRNDKYPG